MFHLTHWHSSIFKSIKSGLIRKNKANKWVTKINTSISWKWRTKFGFVSRKNVKEEQKFTFEKKKTYSPDVLRLVQVFESVTLIENRRTMLWFFIFPVFFFLVCFFPLLLLSFFPLILRFLSLLTLVPVSFSQMKEIVRWKLLSTCYP